MKALTAFRTARGLNVFGLAVAAGFYALLLASEIEPSSFMETPVTALNLILIPFWLGSTTQRLLLAHLHRPSALTRPHVLRVSLRLQLPFAVLSSVGFALISIHLGAGVPFVIAFAAALLAFSVSLPSTQYMSWHRSRTLALMVLAVMVLAAVSAEPLFRGLTAHPLPSLIGMLAAVVGLYTLTFNRTALRARALTPNIAALPRDLRQAEAAHALERRRALASGKAAQWDRLPVANNVRSICRALEFEHFRGHKPWWRQLAFALGVPLGVLVAYGIGMGITADEHAGTDFATLAQALSLAIWGHGTDSLATMLSGLFAGFAATLNAHLYPQFTRRSPYPYSRRLLAAAIVRLNTRHILRGFGALALTLGIFAVLTHSNREQTIGALPVPPAFASLLVALPITGFLLVLRAAMPANLRSPGRIALLLVTAIAMWLPGPAVFAAEILFSPLSLILLAAVSLVSWLSYRSIIHHHYDVANLDQHQIGGELQIN